MIKSGLAWNKGRKVGRALRPQDVWMIRGRLRAEGRKRDLALFNLAIDSKLSACDLVRGFGAKAKAPALTGSAAG
jgi:hypothetical protein